MPNQNFKQMPKSDAHQNVSGIMAGSAKSTVHAVYAPLNFLLAAAKAVLIKPETHFAVRD
jgi:hypothetical protein